jgi:hypothetical protein
VVREWGVRKLGQGLEIRTRGNRETCRRRLLPSLRRRRRLAARADPAVVGSLARRDGAYRGARSRPASRARVARRPRRRGRCPRGASVRPRRAERPRHRRIPRSRHARDRAVMRPRTTSPRPSAPTA